MQIILIVILCVSIAAAESAVPANGGYITRNDFSINSYTEHWLGFNGMITNNLMEIENLDVKDNNGIQNIFSGITIQKGDYLIITTSPSPPDLIGLKAGNIASIDKITGLGDDSGSNTFKNLSTCLIPSSGAELTDVPSIYIDHQGQHSREALLADVNGDPVFAVVIEPLPDKNYESYHFQLMLPDNGRLKYYFFYLQSGR